MISIAHIADTHFGYGHLNFRLANGQNVRENDFQRAALKAAEFIAAEKVDLVLVAGDFLQSTRITSTGLNAAIEFCKILDDIPVFVVGGNHDEAETIGRFSDLQTCANHGNLKLFSEQKHEDFMNVRVHGVPFRVLSRAAKGKIELKDFDFAKDKANVLLSHGYAGLPEVNLPGGAEDTEIPATWLNNPRFDLICLGHIHQAINVRENVFYSGSIERRNFGERNETPGFWIHKINDENELEESRRINIEDICEGLPRPMKQIEMSADGKNTQELLDYVMDELKKENLENAMIKLILNNVSASCDRVFIRNQLKNYFYNEAQGFSWEDVLQTKQISELFDVDFHALPVDIGRAFQEYLSKQTFETEEDKKEILESAAEIMTLAHERLISEDL